MHRAVFNEAKNIRRPFGGEIIRSPSGPDYWPEQGRMGVARYAKMWGSPSLPLLAK